MREGEVTVFVRSQVKKASLLIFNLIFRSSSALLSQKSALTPSVSTFVLLHYFFVFAH